MRRATALLLALLFCSPAAAQVMRLAGTTKDTFVVDAIGVNPLSLANDSGRLELPGGLRVSGGAVDFTAAASLSFPAITTIDINGGTIDGATIGGTTRGAGSFTSLAANSGLTVSAGTLTAATVDINGGAIDGTTIGTASAAAGSFTSVTAGTLTSNVITGTAPITVTSTTKCTNLNVDSVDGNGIGTGGATYGVLYRSSASLLDVTPAGTAGQFLASAGGASAPTWTGLAEGYLWIGNAGSIPTATQITGDVSISAAGAASLASSSVDTTELTTTVANYILTGLGPSVTAEVADTRTAAMQIRNAKGVNASGTYAVHWVISDTASGGSVTSQAVTAAYVDGSEFQSITANKKGIGFTDATGRLAIDVTLSGDHTVYMVMVVADKVYSQALDFN